MRIILGLGNPGEKFQKTRHNLGFMTIDNLQLTIDKFSDWKNIKKLQAEISKGEINSQKVLLAKPLTFMNLSGQAVKKVVLSVKCQMSNVLVIHDDIDLPLGKIRIVKNRGSAGHKGVKSIIKEIETKNFVRFRIGIQPKFGKPKNPEKFVLQKFNKEEEKIVKEVIKKTVEAIELSLKSGLGKAQSTYNICARPST
ncbi:MAG: aminoacyl-tRNA hydrolase [Candidatus Nealsonbacteria bacterium]